DDGGRTQALAARTAPSPPSWQGGKSPATGPPNAGEPALSEANGTSALLDTETSLERLRRSLFSTQPAAPKELDRTVEFFSAPGEGLECVEIARRILAAAEAGVAFDRMAILLRHP